VGSGEGLCPPQLGVWWIAPEKKLKKLCNSEQVLVLLSYITAEVGDYPPVLKVGDLSPVPPCSDAYSHVICPDEQFSLEMGRKLAADRDYQVAADIMQSSDRKTVTKDRTSRRAVHRPLVPCRCTHALLEKSARRKSSHPRPNGQDFNRDTSGRTIFSIRLHWRHRSHP